MKHFSTSGAALLGAAAFFVIRTHSNAQAPNAPPAKLADKAIIAVPGGDFETPAAWTINDAMSSFSTEQKVSGRNSIKVVDNSETSGSDALSAKFPVQAGLWKVRGQAFPISGVGLGVYARLYDDKGKLVEASDKWQRGLPNAPRDKWSAWTMDVRVPDNAKTMEIWLHSYSAAQVTAYVDDLSLQFMGVGPVAPPWPGQYKIKATEKAKLTRADVVGPDGLVYPDWRYAGVPGGIPNVKVAARAREFGALPDDGKADGALLEKALDEVGRRGGGALTLEAGTYLLERPIRVLRDGVVLRGAGIGKTKIDFAYRVPERGVTFFNLSEGATVSRASWIEAHADHRELEGMEIHIDGKRVAQNENIYPQHWGGTFSLKASPSALFANADKSKTSHQLKTVAKFKNGRLAEQTINVRLDEADQSASRVPSHIGGIMFVGVGKTGPEIKLARDGKRGDVQVLADDASSFKAGERLMLRAPATPRWNELVDNACPWGDYRRNEFRIEKIDGNLLTLNQPLRIDFPIIDGTYIQKILPIRQCGVEDLTLEQTTDNWTSGIIFSNAWECFAQRVHVVKPGRWPIYFVPAKNCEMRDVRFDDAWWKGGGGTAYVGWEYAYDCLMDGIHTTKLRHAPMVQWTAAGNVIRNGVFEDSDGQWHSGWTHENLFENCVIDSKQGNGSYGYGLWGSPPEDEAHGPNGPRNVVYNCDIKSEKAGLWMGGMNEGWMILHNRFDVKQGVGIFAKDASFDHTIWGNTFILRDGVSPALQLAREDCIGVELFDNKIFGGSEKVWSGRAPLIDKNNVRGVLGSAPRPAPKVASIFAWQRAQK